MIYSHVTCESLNFSKVSSCLNEILDVCTSFCAVLHSSKLTFTDRDKAQISLLARVSGTVCTVGRCAMCSV